MALNDADRKEVEEIAHNAMHGLSAIVRTAIREENVGSELALRQIVTDEIQTTIGEEHAKQHEALADFIAFWSKAKEEMSCHFIRTMLTVITIALTVGLIILIRGYK